MNSSALRRRAEIMLDELEHGDHGIRPLVPVGPPSRESRPGRADSGLSATALGREVRLCELELELQNEELRRTEILLADARDRYRELFDRAPVGYLVLDAAGRIEEANAAACAQLGQASERMVDRPLSRYLTQDAADALYVFLRALPPDQIPRAIELELAPTASVHRVRLDIRSVRSAVDGVVRIFANLSPVPRFASDFAAPPKLRPLDPTLSPQHVEAIRRSGVDIARDCGEALRQVVLLTSSMLEELPEDDHDRACIEGMRQVAQTGVMHADAAVAGPPRSDGLLPPNPPATGA